MLTVNGKCWSIWFHNIKPSSYAVWLEETNAAMVFQQVCTINKASINKKPFHYTLPFCITLCSQKIVCPNRNIVFTMLISSECICMEQNKDLNLSEMCLKGKNRKVTTKTWCDIKKAIFFTKLPKFHTMLRIVFLWKTCFSFFSVPLGSSTIQFKLTCKVKQGQRREEQGRGVVVQQETDKNPNCRDWRFQHSHG